MTHPLLWVRVDRYPLRASGLVSEYVVASPDDIGRAAERLGYVKAERIEGEEMEGGAQQWLSIPIPFDGIDVDTLRDAITLRREMFAVGIGDYLSEQNVIWRAACALLDAFDEVGVDDDSV